MMYRAASIVTGVVLATLGASTGAVAQITPGTGSTSGGTTVTGALPDGVAFASLSTSSDFTVALDEDGAAYAWGEGADGQLGNGDTVEQTEPVPVTMPDGVTFTQIATALDYNGTNGGFTVALDQNGQAWAWGRGASGKLGNGSTDNQSVPVPVTMPDGVTFTEISTGVDYTIALGDDGNAYAWGYGLTLRLGTGDSTTRLVPTQVALPDGVTLSTVHTSLFNSVALDADGNAYAWGNAPYGVLGNGSTATVYDVATVTMPAGVSFVDVSIDPGSRYVLALGDDGNAYAWGNLDSGQAGNGSTTTAQAVPVAVSMPAGVTFTQVVALSRTALALGSDGRAYSWGSASYGALGNGATAQSSTPTPVSMPTGVSFTWLAGSMYTGYALGDDGNAYAWGWSANGETGTGGTADVAVPTRVSMPDGVSVTEIVASQYRASARGSDQDLYIWGANSAFPESALVPWQISSTVQVSAVWFGDAEGTGLSQDENGWSVITPAACGAVDVVVRYTQWGVQRSETTVDGYTYGSAPAVTQDPVGTVASAGQQVSLSAAASGDDTPTIRWQSAAPGTDEWTDVAGAGESTLVTTVDQDTEFRAVFTNCVGESVSAAALVTVEAATNAPDEPGAEPPAGKESTGSASPDPEAGSADSGSDLAVTGVDVVLLALLAVVLLAAGTTGLVARRRVRSRP